jgi:RimJ/RimL family protein N-acetyltransferase
VLRHDRFGDTAMVQDHNHLGQPIGSAVPGWTPPPHPPREPMVGRYCRVEPLDPDRHAADLFAANSVDAEHRMWTYLRYGPFDSLEQYQLWMRTFCLANDPLFFAIIDAKSHRAVGVASFLRIDPGDGFIEVGHLAFSPRLQRTPAATESMFLMMKRAFEIGYRRYEWRCDALNAPSRAAAQRLGFSYEGVFRQAGVYKGRSRDTAWFAAIDREWPALRLAFERWLDPANFDAQGHQRTRLADLRSEIMNEAANAARDEVANTPGCDP